jgi:acyl carrier protein
MLDESFMGLLRPHLRFVGATGLDDGSRLRDLGLDSMHAVELLFAIEDAYGLEIPDDLLNDETFETAGSLWEVVSGLCEAAGRSAP